MDDMSRRLPEGAKRVFKGEIFEVWQWQQKMYDGSFATFETLKRPDTVQILATTSDKILVLEEQQPDSPESFVSLPGGRCDDGEDSLAAAQRELAEETGYVSDDWVLLSQVYGSRKMIWTMHTYISRDCRQEREQHLDPGERIQTRLLDFDQFLALSDEPKFRSTQLVPELLRMRLDNDRAEKFKALLFGHAE